MIGSGRTANGSVLAGVDLGNVNCRIALWSSPEGEISCLDQGGRPSFPAVVAYDEESDTWLVGQPAQELAYRDSVTVFSDLKDNLLRESKGQKYADLTSRLLRKLKFSYESDTGGRMLHAVYAVPYSYTVAQRESLKRVAELALLPAGALINEPEAAVLGYQVDRVMRGSHEVVLVFNAGGSQMTVSLVDVGKTGSRLRVDLLSEVKVQASSPGASQDTNLCGKLIDDRLYHACCAGKFRTASEVAWQPGTSGGIGPEADEQERFEENRFRLSLTDARHQLSSRQEVEIPVPGNETVSVKITRKDIEDVADVAHSVAVALIQAVEEAGLTNDKVNRVLLAGTLNRAPYMRRLVNQFGDKVESSEPGFEEICIAVGAARCASLLSGTRHDVHFQPKQTPAFGIRMNDDTFDKIVPENAPPGYTRGRVYSLANQFAAEATFDIVQGFSRRCSPDMFLETQKLRLTLPEGRQAGDRINRELHVEMKLNERNSLEVQLRDQTADISPSSRGPVNATIKPQ